MVQRHETVLEIPRHLTIWDLDALRDPWIQKELLMASAAAARTSSGTADTAAHSPPPAAAFLAVYVALRMFGVGTRGGTSSNNNNNNAAVAQQQQEHNDWVKENPILHEYLSKILPNTLGDFEFHPMLWSDEELEELLGTYTSTYDHVVSVRRSVQQEYRGFLQASTDFASRISYEQYQIARLNVMTRSFGTGKLLHVSDEASEQEIAQYQRAGVDLSNGCHAMVPVLDQFNHHGSQPNVGFSYQAAKRAFVVTAVRAIPAGTEIFDSYGKRTDSDLFARYGFVNGDGSEYTQASLALWHHVDPETAATSSQQQIDQHLQTPQWKMAVLRYLQYDDGYESCVIPPQQSGSGGNSVDDNTTAVAVAWELKRTKYEHLLFTGHSPQRWVVRMPPRNIALLPPDGASSSSSSSSSSQTIKPPPVFDMRKLQFDGSWLFSTCRLIVLTHDDYDGGAFELLQANVHNTSFFLPPPTTHQRDALEFRTLMCIARMAQTALGRYGVTLQQQLDHVSALHHHGAVVVEAYDDNNHTTTATLKNWTVAHLRLGEMQTLEALKQTAFTGLRLFQDKINSEPAFSMRDNPCPLQALQPLFENTVQ